MTNGYVVDEARLSRLEAMVEETRGFSIEARDSSRANSQRFDDLVRPALERVDVHEAAIQRTQGAMWALGVVGGLVALGLAALPFVVR